MTIENFKYRTNPLFLRNEFVNTDKYGIPIIPKATLDNDDLSDFRLIGFNAVKRDNGAHSKRMVHFFLYDYCFENIWNKPDTYINVLKKYSGVLTPDFSMYIEMPQILQMFNTFRNRWCGAYFCKNGLNVVPTINWAMDNSCDYCFRGVEKGSTVAISTYMFHEHGCYSDQKELFMKGYNKMLEVIEPSKIICYSEPFSEMKGEIVYVDYELSSWRHYDDDNIKTYIKKTYPILTFKKKNDILYKKGYIPKGSGSAYGGKWKPKTDNDKRFFGKPGGTEVHKVKTRGGKEYIVKDKYDKEGKAVIERHETDHNRPDKHSNPHDHEIDWSEGTPKFGPPKNYWETDYPEFKSESESINMDKSSYFTKKDLKNYGDNFTSLSEVKRTLNTGYHLNFVYNGTEYYVEGHNNSFDMWVADIGDIANGLTLNELMEFEIEGVKFKDFIFDSTVLERMHV